MFVITSEGVHVITHNTHLLPCWVCEKIHPNRKQETPLDITAAANVVVVAIINTISQNEIVVGPTWQAERWSKLNQRFTDVQLCMGGSRKQYDNQTKSNNYRFLGLESCNSTECCLNLCCSLPDAPAVVRQFLLLCYHIKGMSWPLTDTMVCL